MKWSPLASVQKLLVLCLFGWVSGCAVSVNHSPATMSPLSVSSQRQISTLQKAVDLRLGSGYTRNLKMGSQWESIGSVAQGEVFKAHDGIFTVEGAHVHEAYLVISNQSLVGFYLPVERGFVPYSEKPQILFSSTSK